MTTVNNREKQSVVVVGAGLAGSLMAIHLAQYGFDVSVYERRPDMRQVAIEGGRSINLGLSARGVRALTEVGLIKAIMDEAVVMTGRVIHGLDGSRTFQPYGKNRQEVLHSIERTHLNKTLIACADSFPNVTFFFNKRCVSLDKAARTIAMRDEQTGQTETVRADVVIGADGAFSTVRQQMQQGERADYQQEFLPWGYKELTLPAGPGGTSLIEAEALHVWPRGNAVIVSHPNRDGSHTITPFLPFEGERGSFAALQTEEAVLAYFDEQFPDLRPLMPRLAQAFLGNPTGRLVTVHVNPWYYQDWIVLIGDACHAVYPFYGQGMNSALEDCSVLNRCLDRGQGEWNWVAIFQEYQALRKRHTDTLAELSKQNFVELSSKLASPLFVARKKADVLLNQLFPNHWLPIYTMVSHTSIPYADALERAQKQERLLQWGSLSLLLVLLLSVWGFWRRRGRERSRFT